MNIAEISWRKLTPDQLQSKLNPPAESPHGYMTFYCQTCGFSRLVPVRCKDRTCPTCNERRAKALTARLYKFLKEKKDAKGHKWYHIVLCTPNSEDLRTCLRENIKAFARLRRTKWWKSHVAGGCFTVEVKRKPWGWHVHLHIIAYSRWIPIGSLRSIWTSSAIGGRFVHIRYVNHRGDVKTIVNYLFKYITKRIEVDEHWLEHFNAVMEHHRLFNVFGDWRKPWRELCNPVPIFHCPCCHHTKWISEMRLNSIFDGKPLTGRGYG
jgi:hypothetical protein